MIRSICPTRGVAENILNEETAYAKSNMSATIIHLHTTIMCWKSLCSFSFNNVESSNSGYSLTIIVSTSFFRSPWVFWYFPQNFINVLLLWNINVISNSYQFISQVVFRRVSNVPDLEVNINLMHVFGWIISSDDDIIHMCCNVIYTTHFYCIVLKSTLIPAMSLHTNPYIYAYVCTLILFLFVRSYVTLKCFLNAIDELKLITSKQLK